MKLTELIDVLLDAHDIHGDLDVFVEIDNDFERTDAYFGTEIIRRGYSLFVCVHTDALESRLDNAFERSSGSGGKGPEQGDLVLEKSKP